MHEARVVCDLCEKPAPLATFNGNSNFRMPEGWVTISPHVQVHGDLRDKGEKKYEFKERLKNFIPKYHLCPDCTEDPNKVARDFAKAKAAEEKARLKQIEEDQRVKQLVEPTRRMQVSEP